MRIIGFRCRLDALAVVLWLDISAPASANTRSGPDWRRTFGSHATHNIVHICSSVHRRISRCVMLRRRWDIYDGRTQWTAFAGFRRIHVLVSCWYVIQLWFLWWLSWFAQSWKIREKKTHNVIICHHVIYKPLHFLHPSKTVPWTICNWISDNGIQRLRKRPTKKWIKIINIKSPYTNSKSTLQKVVTMHTHISEIEKKTNHTTNKKAQSHQRHH